MCTGAGDDSDTLQRLQNRYGVDIVIDEVVEVDPIRTAERLVSGAQLSADRIVMAPGVTASRGITSLGHRPYDRR